MNKFEEIKAARDGLDVLPDIMRYADSGWESIGDDDKARMKWYGLFFRKHTPGHFMMRLRIPNGIATAEQPLSDCARPRLRRRIAPRVVPAEAARRRPGHRVRRSL